MGDCAYDGRDLAEEKNVMERRDIDDELSATGAQELLASTSTAHLAYIGKDGTPRVIPVGFFWTGEQFVISTATTAPKVMALSARPDVALSIDGGDTPDQARALSIRGQASVETVDGVVAEYLAAARKTMTAEAAAEFEENHLPLPYALCPRQPWRTPSRCSRWRTTSAAFVRTINSTSLSG